MSDFTAPDGFVEVGQKVFIETPGDRFTGYFDEVARYFVREEPVPPLPSEPYTVIRAWWGVEMNTLLTLDDEHVWRSHLSSVYDRKDLAQMVRFEVLSEPRAVTAKAVLDRVEDVLPKEGAVLLLPVRQEFNR